MLQDIRVVQLFICVRTKAAGRLWNNSAVHQNEDLQVSLLHQSSIGL
jgi:hypothetical protein